MNFTLVRPRTLQAKRARRAAIVREVLARKNSSAVARQFGVTFQYISKVMRIEGYRREWVKQ